MPRDYNTSAPTRSLSCSCSPWARFWRALSVPGQPLSPTETALWFVGLMVLGGILLAYAGAVWAGIQ